MIYMLATVISSSCNEISKGKKDELINFFEKLEENDDVQNIYSNEKFLI